ncbi:MAG: hypothetical protein NTX65_10340 [Ignavibacteriales bacterium]|nr:hypothetical protein [Ignavibacteriales bacterium]
MNKELPPEVKKYINKYSAGTWKLELSGEKSYNNIIVVPAIQECENIHRLLKSFVQNDNKYFKETLVIFVVNNMNGSDEEIKNDNMKSLVSIREIIAGKNDTDLFEKIRQTELNVGLIDASSTNLELPEKDGGVGLARKIGMDIALTHFDYTNKEKKILICLDADCTVDKNYLTNIVQEFKSEKTKAAYVQYEHLLPENEKEKFAIICYEIFLRYYVLGLNFANSPFAFPTIGSTMICDYESYLKIAGMNKKKAAEDFYFMEKLAKITSIKKINSAKVYPASRGSWRVPFGTGQRVNRYFAGTHDEYLLYNPKSFKVLKEWLQCFNSPEILEADQYLKNAEEIHHALHSFLIENSFQESWGKIVANSKAEEQIQKQKMIWFDGFRTLKLIHYLRDTGLQSLNMFDALDQMFQHFNLKSNRSGNEEFPSLEIQQMYLAALREMT